MKLIKIITSTIKRSEPVTTVGPWSFRVTYKSDVLPKYLQRKNYVVEGWMGTTDGEFEQTILIENKPTKAILDKLSKDKLAITTIDRPVFEHASIHENGYYYRYTNPTVECSECHNKVRFKDIATGYSINEDGDEFNHDECPICGEFDSFEYKLESISDALKRKR